MMNLAGLTSRKRTIECAIPAPMKVSVARRQDSDSRGRMSEEAFPEVYDPKESVDRTNQKMQPSEAAVREIRRRTRRKFSPEEKIRSVLEGLRPQPNVTVVRRASVSDLEHLLLVRIE